MKPLIERTEADGAIDLDERGCGLHCKCEPVCAVCGNRAHRAIHGPIFRQPPGSKPWGHAYIPKQPATGESEVGS